MRKELLEAAQKEWRGNYKKDEHHPSGKGAVKYCPFELCSYVYRSWADENAMKS